MLKINSGGSLKAFLIAIIGITVFHSCTYENIEDLMTDKNECDTLTISYIKDLAPIFETNCNTCHSGSSAPAGIKTDSYSGVKADFTRIMGSVEHKQGFSPMPQDGNKLSDCNIDKLKRWNTLGKPDN
jgi:hypothetical protein